MAGTTNRWTATERIIERTISTTQVELTECFRGDYGHWITTLGERIPTANPFQQNARQAANFLLVPNASQPLLHSVRIVIVSAANSILPIIRPAKQI